jgi:hypothetical protein
MEEIGELGFFVARLHLQHVVAAVDEPHIDRHRAGV